MTMRPSVLRIVMTLSIPPQSLQRMRVSWRLGCGATPLPSLDAVPIDWRPIRQLPGWMPPPWRQYRVEKQTSLKCCLIQARRAGRSSAGAVRPRSAIDKTQKARRVDTSLRLKNAYEYTSATPVSHCLQHKESPAIVDRWISRRGIRLHDRYCKESGRVRNSSGWIL